MKRFERPQRATVLEGRRLFRGHAGRETTLLQLLVSEVLVVTLFHGRDNVKEVGSAWAQLAIKVRNEEEEKKKADQVPKQEAAKLLEVAVIIIFN